MIIGRSEIANCVDFREDENTCHDNGSKANCILL